jgi:hypothetical protein
MHGKWTVLLLLGLLSLTSKAQRLKFDNYTTADGLPSDDVYKIHEDRKGYLWLFTNYGAVKYNGTAFRPVLRNLRATDAFIYSVFENAEGEMWVANSKAEIFRVRNDSAFRIEGIDSLSQMLTKSVSEIFQLYVDRAENIYAITKRQSYRLENRAGRYIPVDIGTRHSPDSAILRVDELDGVLIGYHNNHGVETTPKERRMKSGGIWIPLSGGMLFFKTDFDQVGHPINFQRSGGNCYFFFNTKVGIIGPDERLRYLQLPSHILHYAKLPGGNLWVGCVTGGLYEIDDRDSIVHHYLDGVTINHISPDSQNGLWVSTAGRGLFHCSNLNNYFFQLPDPRSGQLSLFKKLGDTIFVGTPKGQLYMYDKAGFRLLREGNQTDFPFEIERAHRGYCVSFAHWIEEMIRKPSGDFGFNRGPSGPSNALKLFPLNDTVIFMHKKGFGVAVNGKLLKRIDLNEKTYDCVKRGDRFLVAAESGLFEYPQSLPATTRLQNEYFPIYRDTLSKKPYLSFAEHLHIRRIVQSGDDLWLCTAGDGLIRLQKNDQYSRFTTAHGMPADIINHILISGDMVLLSCNTGLYYTRSSSAFPLQAVWKRVFSGEVKKAEVLGSDILLSTKEGVVTLKSEYIDNEFTVPMHLSEFLVNSEPRSTEAAKRLRHDENNLNFRFDVISFDREKYRLIYNLTGPLQDSGAERDYDLNFRNLPPGEYTLSVYPELVNGRRVRLQFPFVIVPAFWQTFRFRILVLAGSLLLTGLLSYLLFRRYRRRQEKKAEAERLILEYKLIALKAQVNPHFVSNCLTAIQNLIAHNKPDVAVVYIAKFGMLVRQILNFSSKSLVTLREELGIAELNLEMEQLRFEKHFRYEIRIGEDIDPDAIYVPALILNPIIENAIWHGLLPLKQTREAVLTISVVMKGDTLYLEIEDNGVGRSAEGTVLSNIRESKGQKITGQRLSNINYMYHIDTSGMSYTDLKDAHGRPAGTRVTICLPPHLKPIANE